jgi:hypothetical protein
MLRRGFTGETFLFKYLVVKTPPVQKKPIVFEFYLLP